ncbi:MAG: sensor histidine kinase [Proteobacteria bacterium]|nr:sensor histidine kinase [Pseudomonadota bacterium]
MADSHPDLVRQQRAALAVHLHAARARILAAWRERVARDPRLTTASSISLGQFTDDIPQVLDAFERAVRADDAALERQARGEQRASVSEHGLQRWQQGYDLQETIREWSHLQNCLSSELEDYAETHAHLAPETLRHARAALVNLCGEGASESVARYARLQQAEAAGRISDLQLVAEQLRALERDRADVLRQAAHDLRGSVAVITNASAVLARTSSDQTRLDSQRILDRAVSAARALLGDLIELTRLEAGHEQLQDVPFDASQVLRELGEPLRAMAASRGLFLKLDGPPSLPVRGDPVKIQRIAQNLLLNAIGATTRGGVTVTWAAPVRGNRWTLCIADTGPGLVGAHATPLTVALSEASDNASPPAAAAPGSVPPVGPLTASGEGIGLSIVKRLCELLGAAIEVDTEQGRGTTFRLRFPVEPASPGPGGDTRAPG